MLREDAIKKIKKCLALSRSANEHEAAAAIRQAQSLMHQFQIGDSELTLGDVVEVRVKARSQALSLWEVELSILIKDAYDCEVLCSTEGQYNNAGKYVRSRHFVFIGAEAAPTVAGYAFDVLSRQCFKARAAYLARQSKNCKSTTKSKRGDAFALGWVFSVQALVGNRRPAKVDQALLSTYMSQKYPVLSKLQPKRSVSGRVGEIGHLRAGMNAGKSARLDEAVTTSRRQLELSL